MDESAWSERPILTGRHVHLEPLTVDHAEGLFAAGEDPAVWTWLWCRQPADVTEARRLVNEAVEDGGRLPWAQIDARTGEIAGTTSYYEVDPRHRGLCIGYTWIGRRWQRTGLNAEAKLLLLERAFNDLKAIRVGWHTDARNERSQRAIERLGARREGTLRSHRVRPDGTLRDTVVYSMIDSEWPAHRDRLRSAML